MIISIAFCFVKVVALTPIFQNITQDAMPICSWHSRLFSKPRDFNIKIPALSQ